MYNSSSSRRSRSSTGSAATFPPSPLAQPQQPPNIINDMQGRNVHYGRNLDLPNADGDKLMALLQPVGWHHVHTKLAEGVSENMVKEFFAYLTFSNDNNDLEQPLATSFVSGRQVTLNRRYLATVLGVPNEGECIYFKKRKNDLSDNIPNFNEETYYRTFAKPYYLNFMGRMSERHLLDEYRTLSTFLDANILPSSGTNNSVSRYQGFVMYCIITQRQLNLPYIMLREMKDMLKNTSRNLGYGALLTTILRQLGLRVTIHANERLRMPIGQRTLNLRNSHPIFEEEENEADAQYEAQQQQYEDQNDEQQQQHGTYGSQQDEELLRNNPSVEDIEMDHYINMYRNL